MFNTSLPTTKLSNPLDLKTWIKGLVLNPTESLYSLGMSQTGVASPSRYINRYGQMVSQTFIYDFFWQNFSSYVFFWKYFRFDWHQTYKKPYFELKNLQQFNFIKIGIVVSVFVSSNVKFHNRFCHTSHRRDIRRAHILFGLRLFIGTVEKFLRKCVSYSG